MATNIQSIVWTPLGTDGSNRVATLILDANVDTLFNINNSGTGTGDDSATNVLANWLLIDNIKNNGYVTVTLGNFTIQVPPYQRESIGIPSGTRLIAIQLFTGVIGVTLSEARLVDNQSNALLVSQTSVKTLIYSYLYYNTTTAQVISDGNSSILFTPTASNMEYDLLNVLGGGVGNGFYIRVQNGGTKLVTIRPDAADTINSPLVAQYTNSNPLILIPGDSGVLTSDGFKWFYVADVNLADPWVFQPLGVPIPVWDHLSATLIPSLTRNYKYIRLNDLDAYNTGLLGASTITGGAFPTNSVTAPITLAASPLFGAVVHLLNTERSILRAGQTGVFQQDAFQNHQVRIGSRGSGDGASLSGSIPASPYKIPWSNVVGADTDSFITLQTLTGFGNVRLDTETRAKNIGATFYMRIL